jgi:hypothetical protein
MGGPRAQALLPASLPLWPSLEFSYFSPAIFAYRCHLSYSRRNYPINYGPLILPKRYSNNKYNSGVILVCHSCGLCLFMINRKKLLGLEAIPSTNKCADPDPDLPPSLPMFFLRFSPLVGFSSSNFMATQGSVFKRWKSPQLSAILNVSRSWQGSVCSRSAIGCASWSRSAWE